MLQRPPVVVTGMHRSGTSWVAALVQALGVDIGTDLLPGDPRNPRGYFEDRGFLDLNRRILAAASYNAIDSHADWGWTEDEHLDGNVLRGFVQAARTLAEAGKSRARGCSFGWKDPRTSLLLDFWDGILEDSRYIFVYRFPWEVADSIQRIGAEMFLRRPDYAYRIWLFYNRHLLDFYRRNASRCVLVNANALPSNFPKFKQLLQEKLGLELQDASLDSVFEKALFQTLPGFDPLVALLNVTSPECVELLSQLESSADIAGSGMWGVPPPNRVCLRPDTPLERGRSVPLSVVIPCYNHGEFLLEAIASVERGAPEGTELITVNDGSDNERTLGILNGLRKAGYYVLDQANAGVCVARNAGIHVARGRYILPLDADNRIRRGFVQEAISILDARPEVGVVHGDWQEFGGRSGVHHVPEFDLNDLLRTNYVDTCAVLRKQVWSDCCGYDPQVPAWGDWELWINAMKRGWRFAHLPEVTFDYRVRPDSLASMMHRAEVRERLLGHLVRKHWDLYANHLLKRVLSAESQLAEAQSLLAGRTAELSHTAQTFAHEVDLARGRLAEVISQRDQAMGCLKTTREEVEQAREELTEVRSHLDRAREETRAWQARAADVHDRVGETSQRPEETERRLALWQHDGRAVSRELAGMRRSRLLRFFARFRPGPDLSPEMNPAFQGLLDDSYLFLGNLRGYRLQASEDLQPPRFFAYSLRLERPNLSGLMLAPIIDLPDETGSLGIELATPDGLTLASARVSLSEIDQHRPARFVFPPVPSSARRVVLRVDVRDTATPVRLFEWRKRRFFGLARLATRPFCAFIFE